MKKIFLLIIALIGFGLNISVQSVHAQTPQGQGLAVCTACQGSGSVGERCPCQGTGNVWVLERCPNRDCRDGLIFSPQPGGGASSFCGTRCPTCNGRGNTGRQVSAPCPHRCDRGVIRRPCSCRRHVR